MPFTAKHKRLLKRLVVRNNYYTHDHLEERALMKARIEACTEDGKIAVCRSGHDCDHYHYNSVRIIEAPRSVFAWFKAEDEHRQYLDGPERMWIDKPSNVEEGYAGRDVAAEMMNY